MSTHTDQHHGPHHYGAYQKTAPYWKRAHRSWIFWVGMMLTFAAILTYVMSFDLAWRLHVRPAQPTPAGAISK